MRGLMASIIPKKDIYYSTERHFTKGKIYSAIYETQSTDQGWIVADDMGAKHWLSPWDGKDHMDIHQEKYITDNFIISEIK